MTSARIGILLFDGVEELDFVGPYEVFTVANAVARERGSSPLNEVLLLAERGECVTCAKGMRVVAQAATEEVTELDVICIPGGFGSRQAIKNADLLDWVAERARGCTWMTSVCTGAFVLAAAGLTKGRRITTHWDAFEEFANLDLEGELLSGPRYVRDGNLVTAAGISAGIDMALWLTGQMHGVDVARAVQREMQYDPAPPYAAEV
jgi:transcriptional regulator GlxA family with amidase domain